MAEPDGAEERERYHLRRARFWLIVGYLGMADYAVYLYEQRDQLASLGLRAVHPLAASIPALFFISVYANYVGHKSAAEAARETD